MKNHYSVIDWDRSDPTKLYLSDEQKVSDPYSLKAHHPGTGLELVVILHRFTSTRNIRDGRLIFCVFTTHVVGPEIATFRNQAPLDSANRDNCFEILFWASTWSWRLFEGGEYIWGKTANGSFTTNEWMKFRLSWWEGFSSLGVPATCVALEKYIAGEWVKQGNTLYDEDSHFKDSSINRVGHIAFVDNTRPQYWDDTEIWKRTD